MAAVITSALVDLANEDRSSSDLGTLKVNPKLVAAAQAKADHMAANGYFAHNAPDGKTSWYWFRQAGYAYAYAGENLAVNFSDSVDVEQAWMNSPTHRANIMNGQFTEVGIATAVGEYKGKKTIFVAQMFGTPSTGVAQAAPTRAVVPEDPNEPALAVATPEPDTRVLGSESSVEEPVATTEGVAAHTSGPSATTTSAGSSTLALETESGTGLAAASESTVSAAAALTNPETLASSPKTLLRTLYIAVGALMLLALAVIIGLECRRHHLRHIAYAAALLVLMVALFLVADRYFFPTPVVGQEASR